MLAPNIARIAAIARSVDGGLAANGLAANVIDARIVTLPSLAAERAAAIACSASGSVAHLAGGRWANTSTARSAFVPGRARKAVATVNARAWHACESAAECRVRRMFGN